MTKPTAKPATKPTKTFDIAVIGAGPGGYVAAIRAAQLGLNVCIIEREHLGGICLNWGCIPTKALLRSAEIFHLMQRAGEFGLTADKIGYDFAKVIARSRSVAKQLNAGVTHLLKKNKITVIMGSAKLKSATQITLDSGDTITAKNIIIATGARARILPGLEPDGARVWNYKHALSPPHKPKKLLVIGSGAIGMEFASFYQTLGAETTVVEVADRILPAEDAEIAAFAHKAFEKQGMRIIAGASVKKLERKTNEVIAHIDTAKGVEKTSFDTVITAVGIVGNTENLGLEAVGIKVEKGHIITDEFCQAAGGIFAIGDVTAPPWLAHKASHEGVLVAEKIAGLTPAPIKPQSIAGCTYCHPQIASVGFTEAGAIAQGFDIKVGRFPFIGNGKAIALGETDGFVKTIFDVKTGELLGAHMVGAEVTELIQGYVVARGLETTEAELMHTVFPHPTLSEMMHESVLDAYGRAVHV